MGDDVPEQYRPRLCHVVKWPDFQGYGFNLHAEKGKAGQFIGKVDEDSPAETAGLKEGDRIVEVNGVNIGNENHQQVVTRIKAGGEETRLLVVDTESDNYYKEQKKVVRGDLPEVKFSSAQRDGLAERNAPSYTQEPDEPEPEIEAASEPEVSSAPVQNGNSVSDDDYSHRPRLCHIKIWPNFQGYGFNLHAEKDKPGQYIGLVDDDSPSSTGGLRVNDRIIEVNGVNIEQESHTDVIARIKAVPGETKLLVVDRESDKYYKEKGVTVSSNMPQVDRITSPDNGPDPVNGYKSQVSETPSDPEPEFTVASTYSRETVEPTRTNPAPAKGAEGLDLNLSAAEMKERLKAKKKADPRMNKISFEEKYKKFQRL